MKFARPILSVAVVVLALTMPGCGYHTAGHATRIPASVRTIAVPVFVNQTQTYRIEQMLTRDVVREFIGRTHYQIANDSGRSADAVLKGTVISAQASPLTYDAQTGRISSAVVIVSMKVSLADHAGHILFETARVTRNAALRCEQGRELVTTQSINNKNFYIKSMPPT